MSQVRGSLFIKPQRVILNCLWKKGYLNRVKHQHYLKCHWSDEDTFLDCLCVCWHMGKKSYHGLALKSHLIGVFPQVNKKGDIFSRCLHWNAKNWRAQVPKMSRRNNFQRTLCQLLYLESERSSARLTHFMSTSGWESMADFPWSKISRPLLNFVLDPEYLST